MPSVRKYELKLRAEEMAETHLRITEAAIELHGTVGPSRTTMSAVAERAGVERRTLYRHFATEADLFAACSSHYCATCPLHPIINIALKSTLLHHQLSNVLRDAELVDSARDAVAPLHAYLEEAADILMLGRRLRGRRRQLLGERCATPSRSRPGAPCRRTASGDRTR